MSKLNSKKSSVSFVNFSKRCGLVPVDLELPTQALGQLEDLVPRHIDNLAGADVDKVMMPVKIGVIPGSARICRYFSNHPGLHQSIERVVDGRAGKWYRQGVDHRIEYLFGRWMAVGFDQEKGDHYPLRGGLHPIERHT